MLLMCLASGSGASAENREGPMLVEFADSAAPGWHTVNDNVMGGRSRGAFDVGDGVLVFSGVTNTDGGGFASIRSGQVALNLSGHQGIRLRLRGDGRRYTFRLTTSTARHRGRPLPYQADFETLGGAGWQLVDIPFAEFRPRWRGRSVAAPALDPSRIESLGIQIYDKRDGPFRLEIDWIQAHLGRAAFSMDRYHGAHRPLLVFTPSTDDPRLARQLADLTSSRREFEDRDMVLVTVAGAGLSEAGGLGLTTSEARALRERYGVPVDRFAVKLVGKDGGVKRSDDSVVDMRAIYGLIDTMPMRQREMRRR